MYVSMYVLRIYECMHVFMSVWFYFMSVWIYVVVRGGAVG